MLSASMLGVRGRLPLEGDVIHVVYEELEDLTPLLRSVGGRDAAVLPVPHGHGDQVAHPGGPDSREEVALGGRWPRDIRFLNLDLVSIKVKSWNFQ